MAAQCEAEQGFFSRAKKIYRSIKSPWLGPLIFCSRGQCVFFPSDRTLPTLRSSLLSLPTWFWLVISWTFAFDVFVIYLSIESAQFNYREMSVIVLNGVMHINRLICRFSTIHADTYLGSELHYHLAYPGPLDTPTSWPSLHIPLYIPWTL